MKFEAEIIAIGTSKGIIIPSELIKQMDINKGDIVNIDLCLSIVYHTIKCLKCANLFSSEEKEVYDCPFCDSELVHGEYEVIEI